jgi:2-methylisocitrate lyase-like PEP mutase family enzyme
MMASMTQRFRQLIEADEILIQPGIHHGSSARLVERMGFKSAAIKDMEQRLLAAAQQHPKYGTANTR